MKEGVFLEEERSFLHPPCFQKNIETAEKRVIRKGRNSNKSLNLKYNLKKPGFLRAQVDTRELFSPLPPFLLLLLLNICFPYSVFPSLLFVSLFCFTFLLYFIWCERIGLEIIPPRRGYVCGGASIPEETLPAAEWRPCGSSEGPPTQRRAEEATSQP